MQTCELACRTAGAGVRFLHASFFFHFSDGFFAWAQVLTKNLVVRGLRWHGPRESRILKRLIEGLPPEALTFCGL